MPPTSFDKMLETMMMQLLNPEQNDTKDSHTCCKCGKHNATHNKRKKRRRKLKKSCLKTIVCLSKMAKRDGCQDCPCDPCGRNVSEDGDERSNMYCSKCGQLLPGVFVPDIELIEDDQPMNQPDTSLQAFYDISPQQEFNDVGVQVNVEPKEPLSVRIKVCPCPYNNPRNQDENLYHSISSPELSSSNPRMVDDSTSDNLDDSYGVPHTRFNESQNDETGPPLNKLDETTPEGPVNIASIKKLALRMAKVRLVEESARSKREYRTSQYRQQSGMQHIRDESAEEPSHVDPETDEACGGQRDLRTRFNEELEQPLENEPNPFPTNTYYNHTLDTEGLNHPGTTNPRASLVPLKNTSTGCCASTNVYCFSPESGPYPFTDQCEHVCMCKKNVGFLPYQYNEPCPAYPYQTIQRQRVQEDGCVPADPYSYMT